jgi:hypothetical protein
MCCSGGSDLLVDLLCSLQVVVGKGVVTDLKVAPSDAFSGACFFGQ